MKICLFDGVKKFTDDLINHWKESGHEVKVDKSLDPKLVIWADTTFFEFCDISIQRASDPNDSFWKENPRPNDKRIMTRIHDIDAWVGNHRGVQWDWVTDVVFVAKHIQDKVMSEVEFPPTTKVHLIYHSINPEKYTFREKSKGNKIAWVGSLCQHKCLELALQVLAENPEHELHVVGDDNFRPWEKCYIEEFVKRNNLKYFYYGKVADINVFLQDKDYLLLTSFKEAWSYIIAESCMIGLKPLIHNFLGAENIWPKEYIWNKISEVRPMLDGPYNPKEYREMVIKRFPYQEYLDNYDKILYN